MREIKVLITEDEPPIGRFVKKITEGIPGFSVCGVCCSGEEGLELIEKERPDVLITDIRMPGMTGLELIRRARARNRGMYFLVISGYKMFEYAKEAIELETTAYILKPIHPEELRENLLSIRTACQKRNARRQQEELQIAFRKRDEAAFSRALLQEHTLAGSVLRKRPGGNLPCWSGSKTGDSLAGLQKLGLFSAG